MTNPFCQHARAHMSDHLDAQELTFVQRASVAIHSSVCPMCRRYVRSLEATKVALSALKDLPVEGEDEASKK